jgi:hypothetical protein
LLSLSVKRAVAAGVDPAAAEHLVVEHDLATLEAQMGLGDGEISPAPHVAEPQVREHVNRRRLGPPVLDRHAEHEVVGAALGPLHEDVEVAAIVEEARVLDLELRLVSRAPLREEALVGIGALRVLVEVLQVRVRGCRVEVVVELLHVLAVIALLVRHAEEALLEDGVLAIPERDGEADPLRLVAHACEAVFPPAVGA